MSIPSIPPGGTPYSPQGDSDREKAIELSGNIEKLIHQIKEDIEQTSPHSTLEEAIQKLENHFDELKKLISHTSLHKAFDDSLLELNAELLTIKSNFGKDEKRMVEICTQMQSDLAQLKEHLRTS